MNCRMCLWMPTLLLLLLACGTKTPTQEPQQPAALTIQTATPTPVDSVSQDSLNYIMGKFEPAKDVRFVKIELKYADRAGLYLREETYAAFEKMYAAAQADGIKLVIRSATRNFKYQKGLWEAKWTGKRKIEGNEDLSKTTPNARERALKILRFSSMPSTSRHHWGTDMDLNAFENSYFEAGKGKKIYDWLVANAWTYGFCQPYTPKGEGGRPDGYNEEKWHWSYLPIAQPLTDFAKKHLTDEMIQGFLGEDAAVPVGVVEKYVLGINQECLEGK